MNKGTFKPNLSSCFKRFRKKEIMQIEGIDEDFKNIIDLLNQEGFKPYASCDGVEAHHIGKSVPICAYIACMDSPRILDLLAACSRDKDLFCVEVSNGNNIPYNLYGNLIRGKRFAIRFPNRYGSASNYFEKIITKVIDGTIEVTQSEKQPLKKIVNALDKDKKSDLQIDIILNGEYQPYMSKFGRVNRLSISTKSDYSYHRDMSKMSEVLSQRYGIAKKRGEFGETYDEDIFLTDRADKNCTIYFSNENFDKIISLIKDIRQIGRTLSICEDQFIDYSDYYDDDDWSAPSDSEDEPEM